MEIDEHQYTKGFNSGYLMARHEPELAAKLMANPGNEQNSFFKGMMGGKQQYEQETRDWAKSFSRNAPEKDDRDLSHER